jgi:hypothetical protein
MANIREAYIICTHCRSRFYLGIGFQPSESAQAACERLAGIVFTCPTCHHEMFCEAKDISFVDAHDTASIPIAT